MIFDIDDRLYNDLCLWAKANNMNDEDIKKYINKAIREKFNLDKYGDLNDKIVKKEPVKKPKKESKPKGEQNDNITPVLPNFPSVELVSVQPMNPSEPIVVVEPEEEKPEPKPKRKTKVLTSK